MTDLIERLRALMAKATRGPWHAMYAHWNQSDIVAFDLSFRKSTGEIAGRGKYYEVCPYIRPEDASLIAESINALPTLLDALEAKEREVAELNAQFDKADIFMQFSTDSGATWQRWPLAKRVELAIGVCVEESDARERDEALEQLEHAESALAAMTAQRDEAERERDFQATNHLKAQDSMLEQGKEFAAFERRSQEREAWLLGHIGEEEHMRFVERFQ